MRSTPVTASSWCWIRKRTAPTRSKSRRATPKAKVPSRFPAPTVPSLRWGNEHLWANPPYNPADPHNPMMDSKGRVWMTSKIRGNQDPAWCSDPKLGNKYADWFPLTQQRPAGVVLRSEDAEVPADRNLLQHAPSAVRQRRRTRRVYFNELSGPIFGWVDTKVYDETLAQTKDEIKAEQAAVGWCGQVRRHQRRRKDHEAVERAGRSRRDRRDWCCTRATRQAASAAPAAEAARRRSRRSGRAVRSEARHDGQLQPVLA